MHNAKMLLLVAGFAALVKAVYLAMDETAPSREFSISVNSSLYMGEMNCNLVSASQHLDELHNHGMGGAPTCTCNVSRPTFTELNCALENDCVANIFCASGSTLPIVTVTARVCITLHESGGFRIQAFQTKTCSTTAKDPEQSSSSVENFSPPICPSRTTTPASEETTTTVTTLEMPEVTSFGATTATTVTDTSMTMDQSTTNQHATSEEPVSTTAFTTTEEMTPTITFETSSIDTSSTAPSTASTTDLATTPTEAPSTSPTSPGETSTQTATTMELATKSATPTESTSTTSDPVGTLVSRKNDVLSGKANVTIDDFEDISEGVEELLENGTIEQLQNFTQTLAEFTRLATSSLNFSNDIYSIKVDIVDNERISRGGIEILNSDDAINVSLPSSVINIALNDQQQRTDNRGLTASVAVALIRYKDDSFFSSGNRDTSQILSLDIGDGLGNAEFSNLEEPIQLIFLNENGSNFDCGFWVYEGTRWSTEGCQRVSTSPPTCNCTHTTNFALLINASVDDPVLSVLSLIGLILSICGLSITLIVHFFFRDLRKRRPSRVLMHICFNLLVGYVIFAAGIYATSNEKLCIAITFFLHFFLLASWGWMTVYSYDMYISLVKMDKWIDSIELPWSCRFGFVSRLVFDSHQSCFLRKCGGIAYSMALLVSVVTIAAGLGVDNATGQTTNYRNHHCWLYDKALYFGFILPIGIMFLFNLVVFIMVFREIIGQSKVTSSASKHTTKQRLLIAVTMIFFTGLAWLFAFLLIAASEIDGDDSDAVYTRVFNWLFTIFNSLQGLGIFLLTTVKRKETRRLWWSPIKNRLSDVMSSITTRSTYQVNKHDTGTRISSVAEASQICDSEPYKNSKSEVKSEEKKL